MNQSESILGAYLHAVIQGLSHNEIHQAMDDIICLSNALVSDAHVWLLFNSPLLSLTDKCSFLDSIANKIGSNKRVLNMVSLMIKNKRLAIIPLLPKRCQTIKNDINGIDNVQVSSAVELDDATKVKIEKELKRMNHHTLSVSYTVDDSLLAGFKVMLKGRVYDLSFKSVLADFQSSIAN